MDSLEEHSQALFKTVEDRISTLKIHADGLRTRLSTAREKLASLTKDSNRAIKFISAPSYPVEDYMFIEYEMIDFEPIRMKSIKAFNTLTIPSNPKRQAKGSSSSDPMRETLARLILNMKESASEVQARLQNDVDQIKSISSLFVHQTFESRLIRHQDDSVTRRIFSNHELSDYDAPGGSTRSRVIASHHDGALEQDFHDEKQGMESKDLGPMPESIMKYQEDPALDMDFQEAANILGGGLSDDEHDAITSGLPDILPLLPGVVISDNAIHQKCHEPYSLHSRSQVESVIERVDGLKSPSDPSLNKYIPSPPPPPPPPPPPMNLFEIPHGAPDAVVECSKPSKSEAESRVSESISVEPDSALAAAPLVLQDAGSSCRDALLAQIRGGIKLKSVSRRNDIPDSGDDCIKGVGQVTRLDPRGSLLLSIREAAGKPKQRISLIPKEKRIVVSDTGQGASVKGTMGIANLMSDLMNKIQERRDGISGSPSGSSSWSE